MALRRFEASAEASTDGEWGPTLLEYMNTFEARIESSLARYLQGKEITIEASNDLIPLSLLETTLALGENIHKVGFQSGSHISAVLMSTIRGYAKLHQGDILKHYYGFLCVRHLIRIVCIGIIKRDGSLETLLDTLRPQCPWNKVTARLSEASHDIMHRSLLSNNEASTSRLLGISEATRLASSDEGGLTTQDISFLITVLWESRKSILPLRFKGLLPGFPVFLFLLYNMMHNAEVFDLVLSWLRVQDLVQRCYLGNSNTYERNILRQVSRWIHDKLADKVDLDYVPVDDEDAQAVVKAYSNLLKPPIPLSLAPVMLLDISMTMYRWVSFMLTNPQPKRLALDKLAPIAAKAALERLWLEIDRERDGPMANNRRGFTRVYAMDVLNNISAHYFDTLNRQVREEMLRMLLGIEIYSLLGRVLALVTYEREDEIDAWDEFIESLCDFVPVLRHLMKVPGARPEAIRSEWDKVAHILVYRLDSTLQSPAPKYILDEAIETWDLLLTKQLSKASRVYTCTNPRCADPSVAIPHPEAKFTCGRCGKARYCSRRCQLIHWDSTTAESHALECREFDENHIESDRAL